MTRTLFVGEPAPRDLAVYELVAEAQAAAIDGDRGGGRGRRTAAERARGRRARPRRHRRRPATATTSATALGHGIGLATHELPSPRAGGDATTPLPSPTVFSVEPGVYLDGETGVRIEDLVAFDVAAGRLRAADARSRARSSSSIG